MAPPILKSASFPKVALSPKVLAPVNVVAPVKFAPLPNVCTVLNCVPESNFMAPALKSCVPLNV